MTAKSLRHLRDSGLNLENGLLNDSRFKAMIRKSGREFIESAGGYELDYSMVDDVFTLKDEIRIGVYFRVGSKERRYTFDLDRMELSSKFFEF